MVVWVELATRFSKQLLEESLLSFFKRTEWPCMPVSIRVSFFSGDRFSSH
jgi:hypothetical protein